MSRPALVYLACPVCGYLLEVVPSGKATCTSTTACRGARGNSCTEMVPLEEMTTDDR